MMADLSISLQPWSTHPEWLTRALRSTGTITDARVTSCHIELFGEGKGYSGQIARIGLNYDIAEASAPASMIAKFPPLDPDVRAASRHSSMYGREHRFYRDVAQDLALRTPAIVFQCTAPRNR